MFPLLETKRLKLREITTKDVSSIFECFSNEQLTRYYGQDPFENIEQAKKLVDFFASSYAEKKGIRFGIELKQTEELIGTIGFNAWSMKHRRAEVGYEIHPSYWGKGYASEALEAIVSYGFKKMDLTRIGAIVFIENIASNQMLTKFAFEREGILKKYMVQNGKPYDVYSYSLVKS